MANELKNSSEKTNYNLHDKHAEELRKRARETLDNASRLLAESGKTIKNPDADKSTRVDSSMEE